MAALLQRLYKPDTGSVFVGETQLRDIEIKNISVVSQHPNLFHASINGNIRYGQAGLSNEYIQEAAKKAMAHEFITSLPDGYDTVIGDNTSLIPVGQGQRLPIVEKGLPRWPWET